MHRATAYRDSPTPQSLLADAALQVIAPDFATAFTEGTSPRPIPPTRVALMDAAVRTMAELMFKEESDVPDQRPAHGRPVVRGKGPAPSRL